MIPSSLEKHQFSFAKAYTDCFPVYLSIGMTPHQYWDEDAHLAKDFRDAYKLTERRKNWDAWWEGRYVYEAVSSAVSALFAKNKSDITPYPSEPHPITKEEKEEQERREYEAMRERMIARFKGQAKIIEGGQDE